MIPVKNKMEESEFNFIRDVGQLTTKLQSLKIDFRKAVAQNGTRGQTPSKSIYFTEMQDLLDARPRNTFLIAFGAES